MSLEIIHVTITYKLHYNQTTKKKEKNRAKLSNESNQLFGEILVYDPNWNVSKNEITRYARALWRNWESDWWVEVTVSPCTVRFLWLFWNTTNPSFTSHSGCSSFTYVNSSWSEEKSNILLPSLTERWSYAFSLHPAISSLKITMRLSHGKELNKRKGQWSLCILFT